MWSSLRVGTGSGTCQDCIEDNTVWLPQAWCMSQCYLNKQVQQMHQQGTRICCALLGLTKLFIFVAADGLLVGALWMELRIAPISGSATRQAAGAQGQSAQGCNPLSP